MAISTRDPADMTGQERMQEIAAILAACIQRLAKGQEKQGDKATFERGSTGLQGRMKHSCDHAERQRGGE
jgi:hypothetical protein